MAFRATVQIEDGTVFEVLEFMHSMHQEYDDHGSPKSGVVGGDIKLYIVGQIESDIAKWMTDPSQKKDGKIILYHNTQNTKYKTFEFKNAFLVSVNELFVQDEDILMLRRDQFRAKNDGVIFEQMMDFQERTGHNFLVRCALSAEKITIDGVDHDNKW